jgi:HEPN domain-containing protein
VEKALKAALASREVKFPATHDLLGLTELCRRSGLDVPEDLRGIQALAPYGVQMRYGSASGGSLDREQALRWARVAVEWAASLERSRDPENLRRFRSEHDRADR